MIHACFVFCFLVHLVSYVFFFLFLSKFNHPNIVRFLGISTDDFDNSMYLLLELMEGGELRAFVRESRPKQVSIYLSIHLSLSIYRYLKPPGDVQTFTWSRLCLPFYSFIFNIAKFVNSTKKIKWKFWNKRDFFLQECDHFSGGGGVINFLMIIK